MDLIFATNNLHKLKEIQSLVGNHFRILSLKEVGIDSEIPEDHETLEENALQKARFIYEKTEMDCFADDTGLEVVALKGEPGVYSARYSRIGDLQFPGMEVVEGNIRKLLLKMQNVQNREARFRTVISLVFENRNYFFEGIVEGTILKEARGSNGFGYDPVFLPANSSLSFAEMPLSQKNMISHRGRAIEKLVNFLLSHDRN